ncbi:hypothetical protein [Filimonas effusa]|uniref:XRE family transcriptional regulator n=1 Tax=Filimonas effusa TaxID=2508721 RepID=A0A4Q1D8V9_9BACT|nr:hypothetical protein [Filimonas effusa]RXK85741.1 hypothetical protein ESB13_02700 [Filimonas effusa]
MGEDQYSEFEPIKAMFEMGKIKKMKQLDKLAPTKLSKLLGINYGRYIEKLYNPELFVMRELRDMARLLDVDLKIIGDIVIEETKKS